MSNNQIEPRVLTLTAGIVAAHLAHNPTPADCLPAVIQSVYRALTNLTADAVVAAQFNEPRHAVRTKRSIFFDYLICLEDGRKMKTLKRHLQNAYGLTPKQYRKRWNLPANYPMTAPSYSQQRSDLSKRLGLGHWRDKLTVNAI